MKTDLKNPLKLGESNAVKLSLFMPTHLSDPENRQDPIVFKNLLKEVEAKLEEFPEKTLDKVRGELTALQKDTVFWNHTKGGLAILATDEETRIFHLSYPVPASVKIGDTYHILPLLRHMEGAREAILADIARNRVRLYRYDGSELIQMEPKDVETEFTDLFDDYDPNPDGHSGAGSFRGQNSGYHSGTTKNEEDRVEREKYFRYLDNAFASLSEQFELPFILAGTTENLAAFKELAKGNFYLEAVIDQPVDSIKAPRLTERLAEILEAERHQRHQTDEDMAAIAIRDNLAETDLAKIMQLAQEGRVGEFLISEEYIGQDTQELDDVVRELYRTGATIRPRAYNDQRRVEPYLAILRY